MESGSGEEDEGRRRRKKGHASLDPAHAILDEDRETVGFDGISVVAFLSGTCLNVRIWTVTLGGNLHFSLYRMFPVIGSKYTNGWHCNEHGTIYAISSDFGDRMTTQHLD